MLHHVVDAMFDDLPLMIPPPRFAAVERNVYRSAYPTLRCFPFLRTMEIKTIISLTPEDPTLDLKEFCRSQRIALKPISVEKFKGGDVTLLPTDAALALEVLLNSACHPVLIHCLDGRHVTGVVVLLLRKLLMWNAAAAQAEHCRFSGEPVVPPEELQFVQEFTVPIQLSRAVPSWLWNGALTDRDGRPIRHPHLRLRHPTALPTSQQSAALRVPPPNDAALVVKMKLDVAELEMTPEMKLLGCVDVVQQAAAIVGLSTVTTTTAAADRRRLEAVRRSRSAENVRR